MIIRKRCIWDKVFLLDAIYLFTLQRHYLYFSIEKRQLIGITSSGNVFYPTEYTSSNNVTTLNWQILIPVKLSLSEGLPSTSQRYECVNSISCSMSLVQFIQFSLVSLVHYTVTNVLFLVIFAQKMSS